MQLCQLLVQTGNFLLQRLNGGVFVLQEFHADLQTSPDFFRLLVFKLHGPVSGLRLVHRQFREQRCPLSAQSG
ncbi:hypothetical protein D3C80_1658220 [compost metagenome]